MPHPQLPPGLGVRFAVADAVACGVPASRLRRADLQRTFHGARRVLPEPGDAIVTDRLGGRLGEPEREHLERARCYAVRMGEQEFFSHVTAAVIWGLPVPAGILLHRDLDVSVAAGRRLPRSQGIRGHEATLTSTAVRRDARTGLRVASPATTWAALASLIRHPYDVVAVGDATIREWRADPLATMADLRITVASGRRVGIQRLRDALPLVRARSASRPESWARCIIVDAGLPEPELNHDVYDGGEWLACVDLAYPRRRVAVEYEGEHHLLSPEQWARDIHRYERLQAAGWRVVRVTKADVFGDPAALLRRVRAAVAARA